MAKIHTQTVSYQGIHWCVTNDLLVIHAWHLTEINLATIHSAVCQTYSLLSCHTVIRLKAQIYQRATNVFNLTHPLTLSLPCQHYSPASALYSCSLIYVVAPGGQSS